MRGLLYLLETPVQVELPPVQVVSVCVIFFAIVSGIGQHIASAFREAQKDVPIEKIEVLNHQVWSWSCLKAKVKKPHRQTYPARRVASLTMVFRGTRTRGRRFRNHRCDR